MKSHNAFYRKQLEVLYGAPDIMLLYLDIREWLE